jgi:hypothetical protein
MANVIVSEEDTFYQWRQKTNIVSVNTGDIATLNTSDKTSIVNAVNELKTSFDSTFVLALALSD